MSSSGEKPKAMFDSTDDVVGWFGTSGIGGGWLSMKSMSNGSNRARSLKSMVVDEVIVRMGPIVLGLRLGSP